MVDEATRYKISGFLSSKDELSSFLCSTIQRIQSFKFPIKFIRLDNAGEHQSISSALFTNKISGIHLEFTSPGTPQQNGMVERDFAFLYNRVRAQLNHAGFSKSMRTLLWEECANTSVKLDNSISKKIQPSCYFRFHGKHSTSFKNFW